MNPRSRERDAFLKDGLYRVETPAFVAGFVIAGGVLTACAPILRRRIGYWMTQAKRVVPTVERSPAERAGARPSDRSDRT